MAAFSRRFIIIGWRRGEGESAEQTKCGAPPPRKCLCAGGRRPRLVGDRGRGGWGGRPKRRGLSSSQSMLSMQQFAALPAEEERYRQVLSANRVRRARRRSPPRVGPPRDHGAGGLRGRPPGPGAVGAAPSGGHPRPPPGAGGGGREKGSAAADPAGNPRAPGAACAAAAGPSGRSLGPAGKGRAPLRAPRPAAARADPWLAGGDGAADPGGAARGAAGGKCPPAPALPRWSRPGPLRWRNSRPGGGSAGGGRVQGAGCGASRGRHQRFTTGLGGVPPAGSLAKSAGQIDGADAFVALPLEGAGGSRAEPDGDRSGQGVPRAQFGLDLRQGGRVPGEPVHRDLAPGVVAASRPRRALPSPGVLPPSPSPPAAAVRPGEPLPAGEPASPGAAGGGGGQAGSSGGFYKLVNTAAYFK